MEIKKSKNIRITNYPLSGYKLWTQLFCRIRKRCELNVWTKRFKDNVYQLYKFPLRFDGIKIALKSLILHLYELFCSSPSGVIFIRRKIENLELNSKRFSRCLAQLNEIKPDVVFVTNQRSPKAISGVLAAKKLNIPTACMIHSWDNVPKAMNVIETDYYFVWSELMKDQLIKYYDYISTEIISITGTPQFEFHYDESLLLDRNRFFSKYNLDPNRDYLCFSGDDITTSPLDQYYLKDLALSVIELNKKGYNLHIIYRRCPVDLSDRYDEILEKYSQIVTAIEPQWQVQGGAWNDILPQAVDAQLLYNIC